ncbi:hypothetical protein [Sphingobacterium sp.]|uniref:hypothetical protein n=1 Tax=Sphingobacterium sp. TaxID=341027 RepID=UPI0028AB69E8|nr:hypothetical protein [Sphingobacterium sp.]
MNTLLQIATGTSSNGGSIAVLLISLIVGIILFFALRGVILWYYKIFDLLNNQKDQIRLQNETNELLREIRNRINRN